MYRKSSKCGRRPAWMYKGLPVSSNTKRKCTERGSTDGLPRRNTETLLNHAGLVLGMPKLSWSWNQTGRCRLTGKTSVGTLAAKGRHWVRCSIEQGTQWQRTGKRLRYSMLFFWHDFHWYGLPLASQFLKPSSSLWEWSSTHHRI